MMLDLLALLLAASAPVTTPAQDAIGGWAVQSSGRTMMIVTITRDAAGWHAKWRRPAHFELGTNGLDLYDAASPDIDVASTRATAQGRSITFHFPPVGAQDGSGDDVTFEALSDQAAHLTYVSDPQTPLALVRADGASAVPPDPKAVYTIDQHWTTNAEMTAIYDADQADRVPGPKVDWSKVWPRDAARRTRTRALLDAGKLNSGADFLHAAFVFQHGTGTDFLLAHALATIAIARGRPDATWIAAATLDRYLQSIGQPQVYGTQYTIDKGKASQEPYDRTLMPDALRLATGVPAQAAQEKRRQALEQEYRAAGAK